jgi:hypothetical protein
MLSVIDYGLLALFAYFDTQKPRELNDALASLFPAGT